MNRHIGASLFIATLIAASPSFAQGGGRGTTVFHVGGTEILNVEPMENVPAIAGAPFTAEATTEFTQLLSGLSEFAERSFGDGKGSA